MTPIELAEAASAALSGMPCHCYEPDLTEFYGNEPCPKCKARNHLTDLIALLTERAAA